VNFAPLPAATAQVVLLTCLVEYQLFRNALLIFMELALVPIAFSRAPVLPAVVMPAAWVLSPAVRMFAFTLPLTADHWLVVERDLEGERDHRRYMSAHRPLPLPLRALLRTRHCHQPPRAEPQRSSPGGKARS
jgi:hypothetical protein